MKPRILTFGPFELERNGEVRVLRKSGVRLKIQGQPLDILERLTGQPGQVASRHDLQQLLFGGDVTVDFERGLSTAMKRLRAALDYDATQPHAVRRWGLAAEAAVAATAGVGSYIWNCGSNSETSVCSARTIRRPPLSPAGPTRGFFSPRGFNQVRRFGVR